MRLGFKLQVSFFQLPGKISRKSFINISRMGVMTFDKVAVIAVHGTNQVADRPADYGMQSPCKSAAFFGQIHSHIFQFPLSLGREHGFHQCNRFFVHGLQVFSGVIIAGIFAD